MTPSDYGLWFPLHGSYVVGCTWDGACAGGYHCPDDCPAIDFARNSTGSVDGDPVYAAGNGTASIVSQGSSCGSTLATPANAVVVNHGGGLKTYYYHLKSIAFTGTETVTPDTVIGYVGHTGDVQPCSFNHLHFEAQLNGARISVQLSACHGANKVTYPGALNVGDWPAVPLWSAISSDGSSCAGGGTTPPPTTDGTILLARQGATVWGKAGLNDSWTRLADSGADVQAAGARIAMLQPNGTLVAKGGLNGTWVTEQGAVTQYALSRDLLLIRQGQAMFGKAGLSDNWVRLADSASDIEAAGTRIAMLDTSGTLWAKDGLNSTWFNELSGVTKFVLTSNFLLAQQGQNVYGKAGLNDDWVLLENWGSASGAGSIQSAGTRIAVLDAGGTLWAKDGLNGNWLTEDGSVSQFALTPDLLVARLGAGVIAKSGLGDGWVDEANWAVDLNAAGSRIALLDGGGNLWAKDGISGGWMNELGSVSQYALDTASSAGKPGSVARLTIRTPLAISAPSGLATGTSINFSFTAVNNSATNVEAQRITVPVRDPSGQGLDVQCNGGAGKTIAPGGQFICNASQAFSAPGTYTIWADWLYVDGTTWHQGDLGPNQQFTLSAAAVPPTPTPTPAPPVSPPSGGGGGGGGSSGLPPDIHVDVTASYSTTPAAGADFDWFVKVSSKNAGGSSDVRLEVTLPAAWTYDHLYADRGSGCTVNLPKVTCDVSFINQSSSTTVTFFGKVATQTDLAVTATATSQLEPEFDPTDNTLTLKVPGPTTAPPSTPVGAFSPPPQVTRNVAVAGSPKVGSTLRGIPATFAPTPSRVSYQWELCTGTRCTPISGATGLTLRAVRSYAGHTLKLVATATIGSRLLRSTSKPARITG